jgi:Zn-dependent M28 family amino/carboxypeptidase
MKKFTFVILVLTFSAAFSQDSLPIKYAATITSEDLKEHLTILASDALEGRETGKRGQKMAAAYIEHYFMTNGLEAIVRTTDGNSYLQTFNLIRMKPGQAWIKLGTKTYKNLENFIYDGKAKYTEPARGKLVFVGEGSEQDYKAIKIAGKSVLIYSDGNKDERKQKMRLAREAGARSVFIMQPGSDENFDRRISAHKRLSQVGKLTFPPEDEEDTQGYFYIPISMGAEILNTKISHIESAVEKARAGKYSSILKLRSEEITYFASQKVEQVATENVLGFIEGSDKKDEYVIITAHYDHIGVKGEEINNGADDDGSGTVAVMEIAQAFAMAKEAGHGPRRSILFMTVTGEEKGLFGSAYYVMHPALPLEKTIANLNIDMVGRVDSKHEESPNYIYLIGSDRLSRELHELSENTNKIYSKMELDYTYNDKNDPNRFYYRSDHYNFAKNNIPVIFYFNGTHPDYHRPTDTVDKIEFDILTNRTKLVFHTAWEIANREYRISVDVPPEGINIENSN